MKILTIASVILLGGAAGAYAQSPSPSPPSTATPPANTAPGNKAVNEKGVNNPGAPVAGANSFTEAQARSRIEANGFSAVTDLKKDSNGVWRGSATKNGKTQSVAVDFQGNVVAQ